jgi:hypothetical protein
MMMHVLLAMSIVGQAPQREIPDPAYQPKVGDEVCLWMNNGQEIPVAVDYFSGSSPNRVGENRV